MSLLTETYEYDQATKVSNLITYEFEIDQEINYSVNFQRKRWGAKMIYLISFGTDNDDILPDITNPIKLFKTVFEIIEEFIEEDDVDGIAYQAKNDKLDSIYTSKFERMGEGDYTYYEQGDYKIILKHGS